MTDLLGHVLAGTLLVLPVARWVPGPALVLLACLIGAAREAEQMAAAGDLWFGARRQIDVLGFALGGFLAARVQEWRSRPHL